MRLKVMDRILIALSGLMILVIGVGLFVFGAGIFPFKLDLSVLNGPFVFWQRAVMVVAALALFLLGLRGISMLFRSGKEKGFILQHTEYGDLSISMTAMENMVKKCVDSHDELRVSSTRIHHARDGVIVNIRIALANGVNIPITVSALQKQIKQYITSCSGVDVREVRVMVETNNSLTSNEGNPAASMMMADVDAAAKAGAVVNSLHETAHSAMPPEAGDEPRAHKLPLHQRLFRREEKQQNLPQPSVCEPAEDVAPVLGAQVPENVTDSATESAESTPAETVAPTESAPQTAPINPDQNEAHKEEV